MKELLTRFALMIFALLGINSFVFANNTMATLKSATVFYGGAELVHTVSKTLKSGENELIIGGLSPNINLNSLKVKVSNNVVVSATEFSNDYLTEPAQTAVVKQLEDSINITNNQLSDISARVRMNKASLELLRKGMESNMSLKEKSVPTSEMTIQLDYFLSKSLSYEKAIFTDNQTIELLNKTLLRLNNQLREERGKQGTYNGLLKLKLIAPMAGNTTFTITYFTYQAYWEPYYDINIESIDKPIKLLARAKVFQTTGLDWNKVPLTLSTAAPSLNKEAPILNSWMVDFIRPNLSYRNDNADMKLMESESYVSSSSGQPGATSSIRVRGIGSVSSSPYPLYIVNGVPYDGDIQNIDPSTILSTTILKDAAVTSLYGSRGVNGVVLITTKKMEDYVKTEEKTLNMEFAIALPYTIPGNGKEQVIDLKTYETSASYKYYSAPKVDQSVFLMAEISNWEKLNLLSGQANVTYDGTYIGQTYLNTQSTDATLSLTLGTDKRVSIKREKMVDYSAFKIIGTTTQVTLAYKITVRNNQNTPIKLVVTDQYPISGQKEITATLLTKETTPLTSNNTETGVVTWEHEFKAGETKEYIISYSIKYPKDRSINL